ncbi:MAG: VTT domain-containing protein [Alphaproteobacteria bacterium]
MTKLCEEKILTEGRNCWRIANAGRAAVLIDGAAYFGALRATLLKAERSIFIVGWDIDSRTRLVGPSGNAEDGFPEQLGPFLTALVAKRPNLRIHLLLWDYAMLYALDREPLPSINLAWKTPKQISVCLDDVLPAGASHHQKIVVVDDSVAFSGGLDLTIRRWDTSHHNIGDKARLDPTGKPYRPFHDVQMMVDGDAAVALGELVRARWRNAACETPLKSNPIGDLWPENVEIDFTDVRIGIARTAPAYDGKDEIREVEALYKSSIEAAEKSIYLEAQYVTAGSVAVQLAKRLQEKPDLEALIVGPNVHHSWLEEQSMNNGRRRFMEYLKKAGFRDRVRLLYPTIPDDDTQEGVMVHAKISIVDDRFLRIGSANLNNRSMGMDTECDLALEAASPEQSRRITFIRNRLLAEHLGTEIAAVEQAIEKKGSLLAAVESLSDGPKSLRPVELDNVPNNELALTVGWLADPEKPVATPDFAGELFDGAATSGASSRLIKLLALLFAVFGLVAIWRFTPLSELTNPGDLIAWLQSIGSGFWMPAVVVVLFVLGGLVAFPVTVMIAVTGMMFNPFTAFLCGLAGSLLSAAVMFFIGYNVGRSPLRDLIGTKVNRVSRALARRGVLSVIALRMVPIAPFTLINLVAGASHIRASDFLIGTILGMTPGIFVVSFLGRQLARTLNNPSSTELAMLGLGLIGWFLLALGFYFIAPKLRSRKDE